MANPTPATIAFATPRITPGGETPGVEDEVAPGGFGCFDVASGFWVIRASGPLLVDAALGADAGPRQAACFKGK